MTLDQLIAAGLPAISVYLNEDGIEQVNFSRELTPAEWQIYLELVYPEAARQNSALADAKLAGVLKTCTPQQAVDYVEANVTSVATAKAALKLIVRILVAMRNEIWPDLPDI